MPTYQLDVPTLYAALDVARERAGLSWRDVAKETGCSPSTFSRLVTGQRPDADALCTLVVWLGLSLRQFIVPAAPETA